MDVRCMQEAHFSCLPSQSNIYGLTLLAMSKSVNKLLIASLKRRVFCVEYTRNKVNNLVPSTREVQFTYIPNSAEIVSIDAFSKSNSDHDSFVGITLIKSSDNTSTQYLNIYSEWEPGSEFDLENIAQGCLTLQLDFVPYQLTHCELETNNGKEMVWLLSGSDCKIHLFREDPFMQGFREEPTGDLFPEFENLPSIVYWIEIMVLEDRRRITALGCENGFVQVAVVATGPKEIELQSKWEIQLDSPISSVKIFTDHNKQKVPSFLKSEFADYESGSINHLHLLVANTMEKAVVYRDILNQGFNLPIVLPGSDGYDCINTACIADLDMDGINEVVLGSYGQQLLIYKWDGKSYYSLWIRWFSHPLLALSCVDFIGDGINELLVLSTKGLHILQYDPDTVAALCLKRMKKLILKDEVIVSEGEIEEACEVLEGMSILPKISDI